MRRPALPLTLVLASLVTGANAADLAGTRTANAVAVPPTLLPAVSGLNGAIDAAGGVNGAGGIGQLGATVSLPLAQRFGVQIDALGAAAPDTKLGGLAGHAFWRDPSTALIGVYGEGLAADVGVDTLKKGRFGAEAELYLDRMTLSGVAGYEWGNLDIRNGLFVETLAGYFASDDLKLSAGYNYGFAGHAAVARIDWQMAGSLGLGGATLYGEARLGEGGFAQGLVGVKLPFGAAPKSLKRREREDDPPVWLHSQPFAVASAKDRGQFDRKAGGACAALLSTLQSYRDAWAGNAPDPFPDFDFDDVRDAHDAARLAGCNPPPLPE